MSIENNINSLKEEMFVLMTKYGKMNEELYNRPFNRISDMTDHKIQEFHDWLVKFRDNEYSELDRIFGLPIKNSPNGPELWDSYFAHNKHYLFEMKMLKAQAKVCKSKWLELLKLLGITKRNSNDTTKKKIESTEIDRTS